MRQLVLGLFAALLVPACAHRPTGPLQTVPESVREQARALRQPAYGARAELLPDSAALASKIIDGTPAEKRSRLAHDPQLDRVAELMAKVMVEESRELADTVVEQLVWHAGVAAEYVGADRAVASGGGGEEFLDEQLKHVGFPDEGGVVFGVARADGLSTVQVVVICARELKLDSLTRSVQLGQPIVLEGRLEAERDDVQLLVEDGPRKVRTVAVQPGKDGRFRVEVPAPAVAGRMMLEFTGVDERGWQQSLLAVPLYVGKEAPADPDVPLESAVPNPADVTQWAPTVLARINALRTEEGLPQMTSHPAAEQIAKRQAVEFSKNPLAPPAQLFTELAVAGLRTRNVFEYRGVTFNLHSRVERALARPSVKQMLMAPDITRLAVSFEPRQAGGYADAWVMSEALDKFDAAAVSNSIRKELNRRRTSKEVAELASDPKLDALAQSYAEKECAKAADAVPYLEAEARKLSGFTVRGYQILTAPVLHPRSLRSFSGDAATAQNLLTPTSHAGIGSCERGKPGELDNELTVILFADSQQRKR